ncbi:hypothetical protein DL96DRAFT_1812994 [Flagelloscypha sp. PMI_526]|nr:hypothetical protein DL96DRAFT_1812994 [Flagelloscypha sp. PMI_526]
MKFSIVFTLLTAVATISAAPLAQRACNLGTCVTALSPTIAECTVAAAELGANLPADALCLAAAAANSVDPPSSCNGCRSKLAKLLEDGVEAVGDAISDTADAVGKQF